MSGPCLKHASLRTHPMPPRTIEESHRPRASNRTMHCHSSSGQPSGLLFQKTMVPSRQCNGTTRKRKRFSVSQAETKPDLRPEEEHSRSGSARSNGWAECRDKKGPAPSRRGGFSLDIPLYRTWTVTALIRSWPRNQRLASNVGEVKTLLHGSSEAGGLHIILWCIQ